MTIDTCTITGHRPQRFKFKYNEHYKLCGKIKSTLRAEIEKLCSQGVKTFWVGGSMGVDTWAAEIIIDLKKQPQYAQLRLCVALPFHSFKTHFDPKQQTRLRDILAVCDEQVVTSEEETEKAYRVRNEYMINQSGCVIAIYDNGRSIRSGTGMTVNYAMKKRCPLIFIHPDTAAVTMLSQP